MKPLGLSWVIPMAGNFAPRRVRSYENHQGGFRFLRQSPAAVRRLLVVDMSALAKLVRGDAPPPSAVRKMAEPMATGPLIEVTTRRLRVFQRNSISYLASRAWRADSKAVGIASLRAEKARRDPAVIGAAAAEIATDAQAILGPPAWTITSIACGHSRCPDCFGFLLAVAVADALGAPYVKLLQDRYTSGSSHPKENEGLPPLEWASRPAGPMLVVDDTATSAWHLEEALTRIRAEGFQAVGMAWIAGSVTAP